MNLAAFTALACVALAAYGWHAVHEHHAHLRLLRIIRPKTFVPPTRHDTGWHSLGHWKRLAVNAGMLAGAVIIGLAWQWSWIGTFFALVVFGTVGAIIVLARAAGNSLGRRETRTEHPSATERKAA